MKKLTLKLESNLKSNYEEVYIEIYNPNDVDISNKYNYENNSETVYFEKNDNRRKALKKAFLSE